MLRGGGGYKLWGSEEQAELLAKLPWIPGRGLVWAGNGKAEGFMALPQLLGVYKHLMAGKCQRGLWEVPRWGRTWALQEMHALAGAGVLGSSSGCKGAEKCLPSSPTPAEPLGGAHPDHLSTPHRAPYPTPGIRQLPRHRIVNPDCKSFLSGLDCLERQTVFCFFVVEVWQRRASALSQEGPRKGGLGSGVHARRRSSPLGRGVVLPAEHFQAFCKLAS